MKTTTVTLALLGTAVAASSAPAATVTFQNGLNGYTGTQDTWISEQNKNQQNDTAGSLEIDEDLDNSFFGSGPDAQALVRFDSIFGPALNEGETLPSTYVPSNAIVNSASLTVEVTDAATLNLGADIFGYRMTSNWSESDTWNSLGGGVNVGSETVGSADFVFLDDDQNSNTGPESFGVTAAVQAWQAGQTNLGWVFNPEGSDGFGGANDNGIQIASSENGTAGFRPQLDVDFTPVFNNLDPVIAALTILGDVSIFDSFDFDVDATDPGLDSLTYEWDLDGDGLFDDFVGESGTTGPLAAGLLGDTFDIGVRVSDGEGGVATAFQSVTVVPEPGSLALAAVGALLIARRGRRSA